jgi:hypothetical protein
MERSAPPHAILLEIFIEAKVLSSSLRLKDTPGYRDPVPLKYRVTPDRNQVGLFV